MCTLPSYNSGSVGAASGVTDKIGDFVLTCH